MKMLSIVFYQTTINYYNNIDWMKNREGWLLPGSMELLPGFGRDHRVKNQKMKCCHLLNQMLYKNSPANHVYHVLKNVVNKK